LPPTPDASFALPLMYHFPPLLNPSPSGNLHAEFSPNFPTKEIPLKREMFFLKRLVKVKGNSTLEFRQQALR